VNRKELQSGNILTSYNRMFSSTFYVVDDDATIQSETMVDIEIDGQRVTHPKPQTLNPETYISNSRQQTRKP
jgi:hypothetical protein